MAHQGVPIPTPIYRLIHVTNLDTLLRRGAIHAPGACPNDGLPYVGIHSAQTQADRGGTLVPCGPGGVIYDYVGFYFGPRSPMLYRIHTGWNVRQIDQSNLVYLVSSAQAVAEAGLGVVLTDRHSLARVAAFYDRIDRLAEIDFDAAYAHQWNDTADHPDRQEKKQAEFLVHRSMPWSLIERICVWNAATRHRVETILDGHPDAHKPLVEVEDSWYY